MNESKQFKKLPKVGRDILTRFMKDNEKALLFGAIRENLETQNTLKSRHVRLSTFRGLLRNYFDMSDADMRPIENTAEQKQEYFDANTAGFEKQHENVVNEALIKKIMGVSSVCSLLVRSGLRIGELLENKFRVVKGQPLFMLNKKETADYHPVHILGDAKAWIDSLRAIRRTIKGKLTQGLADRLNIKLKAVIPKSFYKRSTHICRAIYISYINRFKESTLTLPQVIKKYLNHDNVSASVHYNHIILDKDVTDFLNVQKTNA